MYIIKQRTQILREFHWLIDTKGYNNDNIMAAHIGKCSGRNNFTIMNGTQVKLDSRGVYVKQHKSSN